MNFALNSSALGRPAGHNADRRAKPRIYSKEAFRALLDRQSEAKVRKALEDDNIPNCHKQDALDWLKARAKEAPAFNC